MTTVGHKALAFGLAAAILTLATAPAYALQAAPKAKININTAPAAELETLPRIGPKVAQRIVDFRTKNGSFKRIEDIMKVQGIGEKIFDEIKELITVGAEAAPR